ncbi:MAG: cobalamin biosynthesis protein CobW [Lachnospiraceae bacterium]|nr:cobalamin biosynthesis protein CobW [Lachnospiraceae bacterium]
MTKIDIVSGFLGAGKTTLIKKLIQEALQDTQVVLIENEFGEIGIDGGFLKDAGIEIKEMNSGCICCSLVGDFGASLKEVLTTYQPDRVLIEPSGVGKLSDVVKAVENVAGDLDVKVNSAVAVVDASKCKMYIKNFGEFFVNQIEHAGTIILSRTGKLSQEKLQAAVELIRQYNSQATIITTPWEDLDGKAILETIEGVDNLEDMMKEMLEHAGEHDHEHGENCTCGCHDHEHHHHHDHEEEEHEHHHHDHEEEEHEHHHHDHEEEEHEHHHHDHEEEEHDHCHHHDHEDEEHEHHHHYDENGVCSCGHHHEEEHHHDHHGHHHADEVFGSWGMETPNTYTAEEIEKILSALDSGDYGMILRSKGMVPAGDGSWIYFDYVPEEHDLRSGKPEVTGKICVIGSQLKEEKLAELFRK